MALKINPETGEQYEDYSDAYQAEAANLPPLAEPPGSSFDFAGRNYTGPLITGYGGRTAIIKPGEEPTNEWGARVSPEYVKDIEDTFSLPEAEVDRKIAAQRPPNQPSDNELNYFEELTKFRKVAQRQIGIDPEAVFNKANSEAIDRAMSNYNAASRAILQPKEIAKIKQDAFTVATNEKQKALAQLNHEMGIADQAFKIGWDKQEKDRLEALKAPTDDQRLGRELAATLGRKPTDAEFNAKKQERAVEIAGAKTKATEGAKKDIQMGLFDKDTMKLEGIKFATTGKMTAMGMGGGPYVRMAIMNEGTKYLKEQGIDPKTVPALQTEYNATAQAFTSIKKSTEQVKGFENGLIKNADYALELSKDVFRTKVIPVNEVINYFKTKTGDPGIVKFGAAIYAAAMEYEKIRTAGTGITSAELSIGAQKKAEEIMNKAMTHGQLASTIEAMKVDAGNVMEGRTDTLRKMDSEMRNLDTIFGGKKAGGTPPASSLKEGFNTNFANGQTWTLKNGKPAQVR